MSRRTDHRVPLRGTPPADRVPLRGTPPAGPTDHRVPLRGTPPAGRLALLALALASIPACGGIGEPRFAEVTVSAAAPSATLSGSTHATAPAIELSPGCPGYLDPSAPEHVVHLSDATAITITARSNRGPLAIAISGEGEVRCDSDSGSGHAPHVTLGAPGDYAVHVASLQDSGDLPYELSIAPALAADPATPTTIDDRIQVSVTITSDPMGATVRTAEGRVLGTTPAMFALAVPRAEVGQERHFLLDMPGRQTADVSGRLIGGALVLHAALVPGVGSIQSPVLAAGPELVLSAASEQPIRDYQVARQTLDVPQECTIERATVDVDIHHSYIADLRVVLRSPRGTEVTLHNHGGGARANLVTSWDWNARHGALQTLAGENTRGQWVMAVHDDAGADTGTFRSFTLHFGCQGGTIATATSTMQEVSTTMPPPITTTTTTTTTTTAHRHRVRRPWTPPPPPWQPPPQPPPQPPIVGRRNPPQAGGVIIAPF